MPASENFTLGYVTDKPWSGYNYYQGGYRSKIEINTDLPTKLNRAVDLGCHEGYPGHHVHATLVEQELVKSRGWSEYTYIPMLGPLAVIAEGAASFAMRAADLGTL